MTEAKTTKQSRDTQHDIFGTVDQVQQQLGAIETFMARRFDEISMEINATAQQMGMAEEDIAAKFKDIFEILNAISYQGEGNTPHNAGVELDAVVEMTEQAANRIMDAAERIADRIHNPEKWNEGKQRDDSLEKTEKDIEEILIACSFQDITGQRIRKTLENLKNVEERLGETLHKIGVELPGNSSSGNASEKLSEANSQDDIDKLFDDK